VPLFLVGAASAGAATFVVSSAADAGPQTFRTAVTAASANPSIDTIEFDGALLVTLTSDVVYTGRQRLAIRGDGSTISGNGSKDLTWDGGLFVSRSAADITIEDLTFSDSFNNGVGVFVPATSRVVAVTLLRVTIQRSRFHGLYVDDQITTGFNTDDVPQPNCKDPYPNESNASIAVLVKSSDIVDNGTVIHDPTDPDFDFDASIDGCPVDFDGLRVDEGGNGGIAASVLRSNVSRNRADGIEWDERGPGGVASLVSDTGLNDNGDTGTDDADDAMDIDEADAGDIAAYFNHVEVSGSFDEGIDVTEGAAGSALMVITGSDIAGNEDEGVKMEEGGIGDASVTIIDSSVNDTLSQQGVEVVELEAGNLSFTALFSEINGNDSDGISLEEGAAGNLRAVLHRTDVMENGDHAVDGEQEAPGVGSLLATQSDLTGNDDTSLGIEGVTPTLIGTPIDP
jgi:hypothetical protein